MHFFHGALRINSRSLHGMNACWVILHGVIKFFLSGIPYMYDCQTAFPMFVEKIISTSSQAKGTKSSSFLRSGLTTLGMRIWLGNVVICWLFSKCTFSKNSFRNTISESNCLDPDQDSPDLGPNCLQRLSADDKSPQARKQLTIFIWIQTAWHSDGYDPCLIFFFKVSSRQQKACKNYLACQEFPNYIVFQSQIVCLVDMKISLVQTLMSWCI